MARDEHSPPFTRRMFHGARLRYKQSWTRGSRNSLTAVGLKWSPLAGTG